MQIRYLLLSLCAIAPLATTAAAAGVDGRWDVLISTAEGPVRALVSLEQADHEVTGWIGRTVRDGWVEGGEDDPPIPISGTLKKGRLLLKTRPPVGQAALFDEVLLSIKGDTMSGVLDRGPHAKDPIKLVRSR